MTQRVLEKTHSKCIDAVRAQLMLLIGFVTTSEIMDNETNFPIG